jgi:hypothetical protein
MKSSEACSRHDIEQRTDETLEREESPLTEKRSICRNSLAVSFRKGCGSFDLSQLNFKSIFTETGLKLNIINNLQPLGC